MVKCEKIHVKKLNAVFAAIGRNTHTCANGRKKERNEYVTDVCENVHKNVQVFVSESVCVVERGEPYNDPLPIYKW